MIIFLKNKHKVNLYNKKKFLNKKANKTKKRKKLPMKIRTGSFEIEFN